MLHGIYRRSAPGHIIGAPVALYVIEAKAGVKGIGRIPGRGTLAKFKFHVGLAGAEPDVSEGHISKTDFAFGGFYFQFRGKGGRERAGGHFPSAILAGDGCVFFAGEP